MSKIRGKKHSEPAAEDGPARPKSLVEMEGKLKRIGGSECDTWNCALVTQAVHTIRFNDTDKDACNRAFATAAAALAGFQPKDQFEGMIAAQLFATHNAAMDCYCRANLPEQTFEGRHENLKQASKLCRSYAALVETLDRHRGKGQQKVTVEHVHVHAGGQAVVGTVETPGGGAQTKTTDQAHAKQITHAPQPPMWSANKEREPVPIARDAERPLPDARRPISGRSEGE